MAKTAINPDQIKTSTGQKLIGRSVAGQGECQEISIGSGLTLSNGGELSALPGGSGISEELAIAYSVAL
jgi:hypothetical protein